MWKIFLIIFYLNIFTTKCLAFWQIPEFLQKFVIFSTPDKTEKKFVANKELKEVCDENQLVLQLARLRVISPERIVLLFTKHSIAETCQEVTDVVNHINYTLEHSIPLPQDNLYMKLYNSLNYYNSYTCLYNQNLRTQHLNNYHECLIELKEDLLDCEGPPDWFEKSNEAIVCQYYNEILDCNYIKTALLCGLKPALMLRTLTHEIMKKIVKFKCKISRSLPQIDDPMPALGSPMKYNFKVFSSLYLLAFLLSICFML